MNHYGQTITWGTLSAPHPFAGTCTSYSYRAQLQRQLDADESGDNRALIQHSKKAEISFEARITDASQDFLDLSAGAAITLTGVTGGGILCTRAIERWALGQPKTASIQATHYPDMSLSSPAAAATIDAFTPNQTGLGVITPGGKLIYGTYGLTSSGGIVQRLEISQQLQITEDAPAPDGTIPGAASHGYLRTIAMDLLITSSSGLPTVGGELNLTAAGSMSNIAHYRVESVETKFAEKRGKMISVTALWIPPFA
ncbi:MAG TPA: hypothetical protein VK961_01690 [Chthoniobacter sp.]|nr:hypothetical protein [Chthoniobacter sp.]